MQRIISSTTPKQRHVSFIIHVPVKLSKVIAWNKANNRIKSPLHDDLLSSVGGVSDGIFITLFRIIMRGRRWRGRKGGAQNESSPASATLSQRQSSTKFESTRCAVISGLRAILIRHCDEKKKVCFENVSMKIFK